MAQEALVAEEIVNRLRHDHPSGPSMQESHETIYQSLYVEQSGELRRDWRGVRDQDAPSVEPRDES